MRYSSSFVVSIVFAALYGWLEYYYITAPLYVMSAQQVSLAYPWWAMAQVFLGFTVYHLTIMLIMAVFVTFIEPATVHSLSIALSRRLTKGGSISGVATMITKRGDAYTEFKLIPFREYVPPTHDLILVFIRNLLTFALLEDIFWFIFNLALPIPILASQPWYQRLWQPGDWTCRFGYIPTPWHFVIPTWYVITAIAIVIIQVVLEIKQ